MEPWFGILAFLLFLPLEILLGISFYFRWKKNQSQSFSSDEAQNHFIDEVNQNE